jgi:hypothetical protein
MSLAPTELTIERHQRDLSSYHREGTGMLMESSFGPDPALMASVGDFFAPAFGSTPADEDPSGAEFASGSGGPLQDLLAVLMSMGSHAVPLPLAEALTVALVDDSGGRRPAVACAASFAHAICDHDNHIDVPCPT